MSRIRACGVVLVLITPVLAACGAKDPSLPMCNGNEVLILMAQAVPSATMAPCITQLPAGWSFGGNDFKTGQARFWLDSDRAGIHSVAVTLTATCTVSGAIQVPTEPDEAGTTRYEDPLALPPHFSGNTYYLFPGGCVTYHFAFTRGAAFDLAVEATGALSFFSRAQGVADLRKVGLTLCGAGVRCPG